MAPLAGSAPPPRLPRRPSLVVAASKMSYIQDYNLLACADPNPVSTVSPLATAPQPAEPKPPCPGCGSRKTHRDCRTNSCIRCCAAESLRDKAICGVKGHAAAAEYLRLTQGAPSAAAPAPPPAVHASAHHAGSTTWHQPPPFVHSPELYSSSRQEDAGLLLSFAQPSPSDAAMDDLFTTFTTVNDLTPTIPSAPDGQFPSPLPDFSLNGLIPTEDVAYPTESPSLPPPPPSQPRPPPPTQSQPALPRRVLLPASGVPKRPPPRPKMTQQMNADWMDDNLGPGADSGYSKPPSSMHIRTPNSRKYIDTRSVRRFSAGVFLEPGRPIDMVSIDECPDWPQWLASKAGNALPELLDGLGSRDRIDLYMQDTGTWQGIPLDYLHSVTTDCKIFLRRRGLSWDDAALEAAIKRYLPPPEAHIRNNLPAERKLLRRQYANIHQLKSSQKRQK
ncbi:hypothetical protein MKEN_01059500 [Mycena kentingensis (nom. inval.)]|nr:hypothetical protein MKEN_01059500 [Mycena kentingensis (nom. inval.)]